MPGGRLPLLLQRSRVRRKSSNVALNVPSQNRLLAKEGGKKRDGGKPWGQSGTSATLSARCPFHRRRIDTAMAQSSSGPAQLLPSSANALPAQTRKLPVANLVLGAIGVFAGLGALSVAVVAAFMVPVAIPSVLVVLATGASGVSVGAFGAGLLADFKHAVGDLRNESAQLRQLLADEANKRGQELDQ